jgi:hypothetical protein
MTSTERRSQRKVYDWLLSGDQQFDGPPSPVTNYDQAYNNINDINDDIGYYAQKTGPKAVSLEAAVDKARKKVDMKGDICENNNQTTNNTTGEREEESDFVLDLELDYDESEFVDFEHEPDNDDGVLMKGDNNDDEHNSLTLEPEKDMLLHAFNAITESVVRDLQTKRPDSLVVDGAPAPCVSLGNEVSAFGLKVSATLVELRNDFDRRATRVAAGRVGARPIGPLGKAGNKALKSVWHDFQKQLDPFRPSVCARPCEAIDALFEVQETLLTRNLGLGLTNSIRPTKRKCAALFGTHQQHVEMLPHTDEDEFLGDDVQKVELIVDAKPAPLRRGLHFSALPGSGCKQLDDLISNAADVFALTV